MIYPSALIDVSGSQVAVTRPKPFTRTVDHCVVYNPNSVVVYLSAWRSESVAGGAGARIGTYAIGPGASFTLPLGLCIGGSVGITFQANTNVDATGAPTDPLQLTPGWSA